MDTRISSKTSVVVAVMAAVLAVLWAPAAASPGDIKEYPLPAGSFPEWIAAGPDGNMWFTDYGGNKIGRITPAGKVTYHPLASLYEPPSGIAAGPDGNMWFTQPTNFRASAIGRITPAGTITEYPIKANSMPYGIAAGPDGNMWFTERIWSSGPECLGCTTGTAIGRITTSGAITEYPLPTGDGQPSGIAAGPDGNMWFTEGVGNKIGRITPTGTITEYPLPTSGSYPNGIASGPDGNMWFTETTYRFEPGRGSVDRGSAIGRITPAGAITEYPLPKANSSPGGIAAGPDGNLWFTEGPRSKIGRITTGGTITEYPLPSADSWPSGVAAGPDGNMWFTESRGNRIGRITPGGSPETVKKPCPVNVTLHTPTPTTVGNRILTDTITTNTSSCVLLKPVVLCRPLASTVAGEKAFCDTKVTKRGTIRVKTQGYEAVRVTVIVRAKPKPGHADSWKPDTWRKPWILRGPAAAKNNGETDLTLSKGLVQGMDAAGVGIKAIRGATLSESGVVTFRVKSVKGDVITHKGALVFSSSTGFVTLQNIALNYTTGKATAFVEAAAVPAGMQITDVLTFTGGRNQIKRNGTWRRAQVALATRTSVGDPAPLFAGQLGLPAGSIASGMTIGKARITLKR